MAGRKNLGRQKIKMERIQNPNHLNVTFSKRRAGLFKKAHELSTMTGAEVGLICFSPAGKAFSYGSPDLAHVANRFEHGGGPAPPSGVAIELNAQLVQLESRLEAEKKKGEELDKIRSEPTDFNRRCWWREEHLPPHVGLAELERVREAMEDLKRHVEEEARKLLAAEAAASNSPLDLYGNYLKRGGADPFAAGSSSSAAGTSSSNSQFQHGGGSDYGFGRRGPF